MFGKEYFVRQAAILFGLAKATTDPKISAALLHKAADLKLQVDLFGHADRIERCPLIGARQTSRRKAATSPETDLSTGLASWESEQKRTARPNWV